MKAKTLTILLPTSGEPKVTETESYRRTEHRVKVEIREVEYNSGAREITATIVVDLGDGEFEEEILKLLTNVIKVNILSKRTFDTLTLYDILMVFKMIDENMDNKVKVFYRTDSFVNKIKERELKKELQVYLA